MDEQVKQEVAVQPSGQTEQVSETAQAVEVAQTETPGVAQEQAQPTITEPVLTEQRILELIEKASEKAAAKSIQQFQSLTDKAENRIKQEVQRKIGELKAVGVELTQEQAGQLEAQTRKGLAPQPVNPIDAMRMELETEFGIELINDDLEAKLVKVDGTPTQFLRTYEQALKAKKDRVSSVKPPTPQAVEKNVEDPKARMVTTPKQGAVGLTISDPDQLFNLAYKK